MVTIAWNDEWAPDITSTGGNVTVPLVPHDLRAGPLYTAHVMTLVAYEDNGGNTRWGFVTSWQNGGADIHWMSDADFRRAYGYDVLAGCGTSLVDGLAL